MPTGPRHHPTRRWALRTLGGLLLLGCLAGRPALSAELPRIGVLYPDEAPPARTVFAEILRGIEQRLPEASVRRYALAEGADPQALRHWLQGQAVNAVITLGRVATHTYEATGLALPQVIGALDLSPQTRPHASGISLSIEPSLLFATLHPLAPEIRRIFVVYNPARDRWLIERAVAAAGTYQVTLIPRAAADVRAAAQHFLDILKTARPDQEALWLLMDSELVDPQIVLPVIIEQSWQRRLVVFSSHLLHVNLGVLFALFPDHQALGRDLAEKALHLAAQPGDTLGIEPLRAVKRALNVRVAAHLGLRIDPDTQHPFDLLLPPR